MRFLRETIVLSAFSLPSKIFLRRKQKRLRFSSLNTRLTCLRWGNGGLFSGIISNERTGRKANNKTSKRARANGFIIRPLPFLLLRQFVFFSLSPTPRYIIRISEPINNNRASRKKQKKLLISSPLSLPSNSAAKICFRRTLSPYNKTTTATIITTLPPFFWRMLENDITQRGCDCSLPACPASSSFVYYYSQVSDSNKGSH